MERKHQPPSPVPLETTIVKKILAYLRARGAFAEKIHGEAHQSALLDIIACYYGRFIHLEVKRASGIGPTARQAYVIKQVQASGGIAATVSSVDEVARILHQIDIHAKETGGPLSKHSQFHPSE